MNFLIYPKREFSIVKNAWIDEQKMLDWVERGFQQYITSALDGIMPIIFLDIYQCHMTGPVVNVLKNLGVEVEHIPCGFTGLTQVVDVGMNKLLKCAIKKKWFDWMINFRLNGDATPHP